MNSLIIDTDIGSDVDDMIALLYALYSGADVKLISTVHGDTALRARIATKLTRDSGFDIPVVAGETMPLKQKQVFSYGFEELLNPAEKIPVNYSALEVLASTIEKNQNKISIAAIGPLTNIAKLFECYPGISAKVNSIYIMGNVVLRPGEYILNYRSHNFKVDPEATDVVFKEGVPITIATTAVAKKNFLTSDDFESLAKSGRKEMKYLLKASEFFLQTMSSSVSYLYDPLAIQHHLDDSAIMHATYGSVRITTDITQDLRASVMRALRGKP